ncbi:hypothetical protein M0R45_008882 [Rubus argutus]|uniref:Uncharacterized protein n=1 Tax=Rubus argutus TaxID=59490 RepID=A0AAW1Y2G3_RUBAR
MVGAAKPTTETQYDHWPQEAPYPLWEEDKKYAIHFHEACFGEVLPRAPLRASNQATVTYKAWWGSYTANQWGDAEDVFRAIFADGVIELDDEVDQRVLVGSTVEGVTSQAKGQKQKGPVAPKKDPRKRTKPQRGGQLSSTPARKKTKTTFRLSNCQTIES